MKKINGITIGGLQQKVFNLVLIVILLLVGVYAAATIMYQNNLTKIVQEASEKQQDSIKTVSENTMKAVIDVSLKRTTALQAYIADDLFNDVEKEVLTLRKFASELFKHSEVFAMRMIDPPSAQNEGLPSAQLIHETGADPENSELLGLVSNMSEIMLAMYENSDKMSSIFVGTADGNMVLVNDRPGVFLSAEGTPLDLDIRNRPWYVQAASAGGVIFTGVEIDAYTDNKMLECAAPVYKGGELVAVVAADIYLTSIDNYVESTATDEGFVCVINENGQLLFSPSKNTVIIADEGSSDLRQSENTVLAQFVTRALQGDTAVEAVTLDDKEYYAVSSFMPSMGWAVISVVDKQATQQPTDVMLASYKEINDNALADYEDGLKKSSQILIIITVVLIVSAIGGALIMSSRMVKQIERMTRRINELGDSDEVFEMENVYHTKDEIEILAQSFASLSERARDYIKQITDITAEKERISTELTLATRIQADMLPNIYPAFPDRKEFDIYATMDPAKEVGGDFYDFFLIDEDHLCMVMADVSGKGVPAALFMMASKIMLSNNAMMGKSPAQILTDTNAAICSNNREEMFVTVWLGILEISTGKITAANAGHEYPVLKKANGIYELIKDKHGFVIGGMDGIKYKDYTLELEPGAKLFLYTDGVPEATDSAGRLFGCDNMLATLNNCPAANAVDTLKNVRSAVDRFVRDAEQFDDLTMLCLEYYGKQEPDANCE